MSLSHHVPHSKAVVPELARFEEVNQALPKYELPKQSISSRSALKIVRNELRLDGNPDLNLASFVTTEVRQQ
jgi:glutamate decarboxylase